jgi:hypothetical protein
MVKLIKTLYGDNYSSGGWHRYGYFPNKTLAQNYANKLRQKNKRLELVDTFVRTKLLSKGWVVDEFDA